MTAKAARHRERVRRMCTSKVRYPSLMAALDAAVRTGLTWYRCPRCRGWHLTSRKETPGGRGQGGKEGP